MLQRCISLLYFASLLNGQSRIELLRRAANFYNDVTSFDVKGNATAKVPGTSWQITYDSETEAAQPQFIPVGLRGASIDRKSTRLNSSH